MPSTRARLGDAVTPGLTGLSIAAGIVREAVGAVPVVKQVLGVIVRILALAEKIDKDRDALHELVRKSVKLAERVNAVLGDRTADEVFQPSIDRIRGVLEEIADYMQKHVSRTRLSRTFGYVFTVKLHVDHLSRKLEDALQEIFMVAHLTTTLSINDGARFDGEFRLFRHCEVDKLDLIRESLCKKSDGNTIVRYHRARVDGTPVVVRYFAESVSDDTCWETYESVLSCDRILEELSTVQRSHPNVARIYGRSKGSIHDRFTAFKSGYYLPERILDDLSDPTTNAVQWAFKDAVEHLRRQGICWRPPAPPYVLDEHLEPTIGLQNDLRRINPEIDQLNEIASQVWSTVHPFLYQVSLQEVAATDVRAAVADCHNEKLTSVLGKFETLRRRRSVFPRCSLSNGFALKDGTAERLLRLFAVDVSKYWWQINASTWADILLALDKGRSHKLRNVLLVVYTAYPDGSEWLVVHGLAEDSEHVVYDRHDIEVPDAKRGEFRAMLGIPPTSQEYYEPLMATAGPGTYRAPE